MNTTFRYPAALLALLAFSFVANAGEELRLDFNDPSNPFIDRSPEQHNVHNQIFTEGGLTGQGTAWSDAAPQSPAGGGYAVFDGGSYLSVDTADSLHFPMGSDFTIRFWFKSEGVNRPGFGRYGKRMHVMGFGSLGSNLDVDFDDVDSGGQGHWTYWTGGGTNYIWSHAGTTGLYTDGLWYHYWLVRKDGVLRLYIGNDQGDYELLGTVLFDGPISSVGGPNWFGRAAAGYFTEFGWFGAMDEIRIGPDPVFPVACNEVF